MKNVTFLGLGIMGGPMAAHIQRAGHQVTVFNRSPGTPGEALALEAGCTRARSLPEAVSRADIVCTCLSDEAAVQMLLGGEAGVLDAMRPGAIVVDFTTIGARAAQRLAAQADMHSVTFIDAPVTGGDVAARAGTLTVMAGASADELARVASVLDAVSSRVVPCGQVGAGQAAKLINQLMVAVNLAGVCEALAAARALGISPEVMVEACGQGAAGSWQLSNLGLKAAQGEYRPGFKVAHLLKDLRLLGENLADDAQPAFASEVHARLAALVAADAGLAHAGSQALFEAYRPANATAPEPV